MSHSILQISQKHPGTAWVMYSREGRDQIFDQYISSQAHSISFALIYEGRGHLFISQLDKGCVAKPRGFTLHIIQSFSDGIEQMYQILKQSKHPKHIALNYSTMGDIHIDQLGVGAYKNITSQLRKKYKQDTHPLLFMSAEAMVYELVSSRSTREIECMKIVSHETDALVKRAFKKITPGITETEFFDLVQNEVPAATKKLINQGVTSADYAWEKTGCPIVLSGVNLKKEGHAKPSSRVIKPGDTLYADFGLQCVFADNTTVSSDLQRMGYMLREGESTAPKKVQDVFDTLYASITTCAASMHAGSIAHEADKVARETITQAGYPNYEHATGHPIGKHAHESGAVLAPKGRTISSLPLAVSGTYTIEPRIQIPNGGSIEEMVVVQKHGAEFISPRQEHLWLVTN